MDLNAAAEFAADSGYNKFTFDGKTYTLDNNNAENTIKLLEADAGGYGYNKIKKDSVMGVKNNPVNVINYYYDQETMKNIRGPSYTNPYRGN
jgi:hypothetical protein